MYNKDEMLKNAIKNKLLGNVVFSEKKMILLEHGIDILISDGRNYLCVLFLSFLFKNTNHALLYLIVLSSLRVHTGGWHASTELMCFLSYQGMFILFSFLNLLDFPDFICTILMLLSTLYIIRCAPIEHKYNPMSDEEIKKNQHLCYLYCFFYLLLFFLFQMFLTSSYSQDIVIAFVYNAILMILLQRSKAFRYYEN